MKKLKLKRNLRKSLMRGHPWVYTEALDGDFPRKAEMVQLSDGRPIGWGIFDPTNVIGFRLLSVERKPFNKKTLWQRLERGAGYRKSIGGELTNCYRLINGEGDLLPGLVCDIYDRNAVLQFDGQGMADFWLEYRIADWLRENLPVENVILKSRHLDNVTAVRGEVPDEVIVRENGHRFAVDIVNGQKTGFFIDQRENRKYLQGFSAKRSVLNLFSYSGGFSVYAGAGEAKKVTSVDISAGAIEGCEKNWELNGFKVPHCGVASDVYRYLEDSDELWDLIIVDPPSMAPSEKTKASAIRKYTEIFALAAERVRDGGDLVVSSCSSHISFDDFFRIISESLSASRRTGQVLRVSGQGFDHPFPQACPELRYLKFVHIAMD